MRSRGKRSTILEGGRGRLLCHGEGTMRRLSLVGLLSTVTLAAFAVACRDDLKSPAEPANPANPVNPALKAVAGPLPPPTLPFRPDHQGSLPGAAHFNRVSRPGGANF